MPSNIILITDDEDVTKILKPKLFLLRDIDNVVASSYSDAIINIKKLKPKTVLIYCGYEKEKCLSVIKAINTNEELSKTVILLVVKEYDQDFILSAYDENITDYFTLKTDEAEILVRIISGLKKNSLTTKLAKQNKLLKEIGVINEDTGVYSSENCDEIFKIEFDAINKNNSDGILILLSPSEESKIKLNQVMLSKAIKASIRNSDVLTHSTANRFYILLPDTNLKGAFAVWDKIKLNLGESNTLNAALSTIGEKSFSELKNILMNALVEAMATKQEMIIVNEENKNYSDEWLEKANAPQKNFKLFKQAFNKKLDKVITPVFFQTQKLYEEKLFQTKIEQYSNTKLSSFKLKKDNQISELKITYPGFSKINIDIYHQGLDSPENRRICLDLTELDETKLTEILEDFIKEFKTSTEDL